MPINLRLDLTLLPLTLAVVPACLDADDTAQTGQEAASKPDTALCYPASGHKVSVRNADDLRMQLGHAKAGDHLVLDAGSYGGAFGFTSSGRADAPIVVEPAPGKTVTITGTITISGSHTVVRGLAFDKSGRIVMTGDHERVTGCSFSKQNVGDGGIITTDGNAFSDNRIDHNDFDTFTGAAYRSQGFKSVDDNRGVRLDHNHFAHHTVGPGNESVVLVLTDGYGDSELVYDTNLFEDVLRKRDGEAELVTIKTGYATFRNNTVIDDTTPSVNVSLRQTQHTLVADNFLDGANIRVCGNYNMISGNRLTTGSIQLLAGDGQMADKPGSHPPDLKGVHAAARHTQVTDNLGSIEIGKSFGSSFDVPAFDTTLRHNDTAATRDGKLAVQVDEANVGSPSNHARELGDGDVGPGSDDPSCP